MKLDFPEIKADFITDPKGKKKFVVLKIEQFQELLETLEDYHDIAQAALAKRETDQFYTIEEVEKRIRGAADVKKHKRS